ncbi:MAG TPA: T9SS type A sorting domain-containing protein [Lentimicrobium sp.]|nr:T9SS type A sorting domain-containing protein [Lentimicrobium sp.]
MKHFFTLLLLFFACSLSVSSQNLSADDPYLTGEQEPGRHLKPTGMVPLYDSILFYRYDRTTGMYLPESKQKNFFYDNHGNLVYRDKYECYYNMSYLEYSEMSTYNSSNQLVRKTAIKANNDTLNDLVIEYNQNGLPTLTLSKELQFDQYYIIDLKEVKSYDNNGRLLSTITDRRQVYWDSVTRTKLDNYYENDRLQYDITSECIENSWTEKKKTIYTYNTEGRISEAVYKTMSATGSWDNLTKILYVYDNIGNVLERLSQKYVDGAWVNNTINYFTYVADKVLTRQIERWIDGNKVHNYKENNSYDANLNRLRSMSYVWIDTTYVLETDYKYRYDADNLLTSDSYIFYDYEAPQQTIYSADSTLYFFRKVLSVPEPQKTETVSIYPNPTNGQIKVNTTTRINSVELYKITGESLGSIEVNSNVIDLSHFPSNIYVLKIITGNEVVLKKVVLI